MIRCNREHQSILIVFLVERDVNWTYFPLNWERHYEIYVGRENAMPAYGHFIEFSFHPGYDGIDSHMKKSTVEWTDTGVIFKEAGPTNETGSRS